MRKLLFAVVMLLMIQACKKSGGECGGYADISSEYQAYWYHPTGTTWIYKAKDTNLYDTVEVKRAIRENNEGGCYVAYQLNLRHSFYNEPNEREEFFADGGSANPYPILTYRTKLKKNFPIYFYYENAVKQDSVEVNGVYYKKGLIFNAPQRVEFASGVGIVRVMADDSLKWELLSFSRPG
ncbi:MAG: hypothetical protein V4616_08720 [Bacteroidota bacterium]